MLKYIFNWFCDETPLDNGLTPSQFLKKSLSDPSQPRLIPHAQ